MALWFFSPLKVLIRPIPFFFVFQKCAIEAASYWNLGFHYLFGISYPLSVQFSHLVLWFQSVNQGSERSIMLVCTYVLFKSTNHDLVFPFLKSVLSCFKLVLVTNGQLEITESFPIMVRGCQFMVIWTYVPMGNVHYSSHFGCK